MERSRFYQESQRALSQLEAGLGSLEHDAMDVDLAGDVLTLTFGDGSRFIINAHSAAGQIWMAAQQSAWHFDFDSSTGRWIAPKTNEELMAAVAAVVGRKLGVSIVL